MCFSPCRQERRRQRREGLYIWSEYSVILLQVVDHSLPPAQRMTFVITEILRATLLFSSILFSYPVYIYIYYCVLMYYYRYNVGNVLTKFKKVRYFQGPP